jgi:hypothetical protein
MMPSQSKVYVESKEGRLTSVSKEGISNNFSRCKGDPKSKSSKNIYDSIKKGK